MSRLYLRRGRVLPGPLKVLQRPERRHRRPAMPLALASAALASALLLTPQGPARLAVDPEPVADARPDDRAAPAPVPLVVAATPYRDEPVVTPTPAPRDGVAPEPARPAPPPPVKPAAAAPARPPVDPSLFQLDLLPVLQAGGADLDVGGVSSSRVSPRAARRTTASRGGAPAASDVSAQP